MPKIRRSIISDAIIYTGDNDDDVREFLGYPRCEMTYKFRVVSTYSYVPPIGSAIFYNAQNNVDCLYPGDYEVIDE